MQRRSLLILGALVPMGMFGGRYVDALKSQVPSLAEQRETAEQLNELAANIRTPADARRLVDFVATLFSRETPHALRRDSLLSRISQAEFSAVTDPNHRIPEQRMAEAWNAYAEIMQVHETSKVTVPEIHYLRDSFLTTSRLYWARDHANFWTVPSIYATQADGSLAPGCRAIEAIRILCDLSNHHENLNIARDGLRHGIIPSDLLRESQAQASPSAVGNQLVAVVAYSNPLGIAQRQYIRAHGMKAFCKAVIAMVESTLA